MLSLIFDILDQARLDEGELQMSRDEISIQKFFKELNDLFRIQAR